MNAGFYSQNIRTIDNRYICSVCRLIFREPVQLHCGHRYCQSCVAEPQALLIKCVQCDADTLGSKMFVDRGIRNDMQDLHIICSFCNWNGMFKNYQDHLLINHSNRCVDQMNQNRVVFQIPLSTGKNKEFTRNSRMLKATIDQILFQLSPYKLSVEEQTPPLQIPQHIDNSTISYYGILSWKIDDIKKKLNRQSDGQPSSLTSSPFYTSQHGYKMCVRLYFRQDNVTQSTHVSIYLILMRGEYDALLKWPFDYQVIFCLYDQKNQTDHIIKSFQCDGTLNGFQRPDSEMNGGCGLSRFFSLSSIQQENDNYVCNDTMYVRVMVRKDHIPEKLLYYVMSIDPAFPLDKQEELIREEIRKHQLS